MTAVNNKLPKLLMILESFLFCTLL